MIRTDAETPSSSEQGGDIDPGSNASSRAGANPLICTWCGGFYKNSVGLKLHQRACKQRPSTAGPLSSNKIPTPPKSNRSPTLRDLFKCQLCPNGFSTQRGLSTHMNKKHKKDWDKAKKDRFKSDGPRQHRWTDGDRELLCLGEEEYRLLPPGERKALGVNQYIRLKFFPTLTSNAVSTQRKTQSFKNFCLERESSKPPPPEISELDQTSEVSTGGPPPRDPERTPASKMTFSDLSSESTEKLKSQEFGPKILAVHRYLMRSDFLNANKNAELVFDEMARRFTKLSTPNNKRGAPISTKSTAGKRRKAPNKEKRLSPSKAKRRELYAMVQKQWRGKKRKGLVDAILRDSLGKTRDAIHPPEQLADFWKGLFSRESPLDNRPLTDRRQQIPEIDNPITESEVAASLKRAKEAATGPDGVPLKHLREIGSTALAILYNGLFCLQKIPQSWKEARTVLIPKNDPPTSPGDYRPITISSYYYRIYTSTIGKRIADSIPLSDRQKGFTKTDGIRDNLVILETLLEDAKRSSSSLHLTFMDVKKAFDSVSHHAIDRTLEWAGVPDGMRGVIADLYRDCTTNICGIKIDITRGVKQGDPLSSTLFNLVLEMALSKIPERLGIKYEGVRFFYIAFADDLVLLSRSQTTNQLLVDRVCEQLGHVGLELHPAKCQSVAIQADPKRKTTFIDEDQKITILGSEIPSLDTEGWYKYLGIRVGCRGMPKGSYIDDIKRLLDNISRAPLKPHQRLYVLKTHVLTRFNHRMIFEKVACGTLESIDKLVREYTRKWLKLPKDIPNAAFYADVASGGLGLLSLRYRVPMLKRQRFGRMCGSEDPLVRAMVRQEPTKTRMEIWRKRCLCYGESYSNKYELAHITRQKLWRTCDGKGLKTVIPPATGRASFQLLTGENTSLKSAQVIGAVSVRLNSLNTPVRKNRAGRNPATYNLCDKCPGRKPATLGHISQTCPATHGLRVKRHDKIVKKIAGHFEKRAGTQKVLVEPRLKLGAAPVRKPDLVIDTGDTVEIIDVQVVADQGIVRDEDADEAVKLARYDVRVYRDAAFLALGLKPGSVPCNVSAFTLTWRGNPAPHSYKLARRLGFKSLLKFIVADSLADTWGMYTVWNKTS